MLNEDGFHGLVGVTAQEEEEEEEATKFKPNQGREGKNCRFGRSVEGERESQKLLKSWGKKPRPAEITGIELL